MMRMNRRLPLGVLVLAAMALAASPAAAQSRREMQMMADIRMLQEQTQQLQQQLQAALAQISDNLKALSTKVDDQSGATRKAFADQKIVVDQLGSDLRVVRERMDDTNVRITSLSQEVEALRLAIPQGLPSTTPPDLTPCPPPSHQGHPRHPWHQSLLACLPSACSTQPGPTSRLASGPCASKALHLPPEFPAQRLGRRCAVLHRRVSLLGR